jgi:tRNA/tmRNA/rRNA uracil-C5-methylase (TrmA/RlmC/RlmD family)
MKPQRVYAPDFPGPKRDYKTTRSSFDLYSQKKIMKNMCEYLNTTMFPKQSVVVDCLANVGCDSIYLSSLFKKVYAVEPREDEHKSLTHNLKLFRAENIEPTKMNLIPFIHQLTEDEKKQVVFYLNLEFFKK